tara:strand:+ start:6461 stop:7774 length:1314 start_codon:yes stop_codon:yes gene_type:complete
MSLIRKKPIEQDEFYRRLRRLVHRRLVDSIEGERSLELGDIPALSKRVETLLDEYQYETNRCLAAELRREIIGDVLQEMNGMGPLSPLMDDAGVSDILVNGADEIWIDRRGQLEKTDIRFDDEAHLRRFVDRLVGAQGRQLDAGAPTVDAKLPDGSRLHAVIPPLCGRGTILSIRRFRVERADPDVLIAQGFIDTAMLQLLEISVRSGLNVVIAGGASAGKTSLLNLLARYIPSNERIVTVEETAELRLQHPHVIPLESRPSNREGNGGVGLSDLVRTALRMRADRIIVGEVRGVEVFDMLQAMNVGHDGSLTTVHANSPQDVLRRLEALALQGGSGMMRTSVREMIGSAIQVVVQLARFSDGSRRVISLGEVTGDDGNLKVRELYRFETDRSAVASGTAGGCHRAIGEPRVILERAAQRGIDLSGYTALRSGGVHA